MKPKLLLLGYTGKMGLALQAVLSPVYDIAGLNSRDFDAADWGKTGRLLDEFKPAVLVNAVAFMGIDACETNPRQALAVNTLFPECLAAWAARADCLLVQFSSEAVFPDAGEGQAFVESSTPRPINMYGFTKFGGDCFVSAGAPRHYIFRLPMLFGESRKGNQFIEKIAARILAGEPEIKVAVDCWTTPSYSLDLAGAVRDIMAPQKPYGLYHLANDGQASLFDIVVELAKLLRREVRVTPVLHSEFPSRGIKNLRPILASEKTARLRPWQEALRVYVECMMKKGRFL